MTTWIDVMGPIESAYRWLGSDPGRQALWGVVSRGMGAVFILAFYSHLRQALFFIGERGVSPLKPQLAAMRRDLSLWDRLRLCPSLLWLFPSDRGIQGLLIVGMIAGAGIIVGGPHVWILFILCYLIALSYQMPMRLHYPWDAALVETAFLALFLPATARLPEVAASALPHPLVAFAFHFLLFRLVFSFGKEKFIGTEARDSLYSRYFLISIPSPSAIGWYFTKLPDVFHRFAFAFTAFGEIISPLLILVGGPFRIIGALGIAGQMLAIQINSNFGFFNIFALVLCVAALDHSNSVLSALDGSPGSLGVALLLGLLILGGLVYLPFNSWVSSGFLHWTPLARLPRGPLRALLALLRWLSPLRILNAYGVFGPHPAPPVRWVPIIEGSADGETWRTYPYRHQMVDDFDPPRIVAPHHPRLEGVTFYEVYGVEALSYGSVLNFDNPYWFSPRAKLLPRLCQRLLEGAPEVRGAFRSDPFPGAPPTQVRVRLRRYLAASLSERLQTGRWWRGEDVGVLIPPTGLDPQVWEDWIPTPELFHLEASHWRARARGVPAPTPAELEALCADFLPWLAERAAGRTPLGWDDLPALALQVRRRYDAGEVRALRRTLGRLTVGLMAALDAVFDRPATHFWRDVAGFKGQADGAAEALGEEGRWQALAAWPGGPLRDRLRVGLLAHRILLTQPPERWRPLIPALGEGAGEIAGAVRLSRGGRRSMAAAAREVGLSLDLVRPLAEGLTLPLGFVVEGALDYPILAEFSGRLNVLFTFERVFEPLMTGMMPGVYALAREVGAHALPSISGWGEDAQLTPPLTLPRMVFGADGVWRSSEDALRAGGGVGASALECDAPGGASPQALKQESV